MTNDERIAKAASIYKSMENVMTNLYGRWLDEKEYEDFSNYADVMKKEISGLGGEFVAASKRPFGFKYALAGATYQMTISARSYNYKRIA